MTSGQIRRALTFTARVWPEEDMFIAQACEVEVASQGRTVAQALANLQEALELYFEGEDIPDSLPDVEVHKVEILVAA